jgi:hypothetical protein
MLRQVFGADAIAAQILCQLQKDSVVILGKQRMEIQKAGADEALSPWLAANY